MLVKIEGKTEVLKDLEEVMELVEKMKSILYRIPTKIEINVTECDTDAIISDSRDIQ